MKRFDIIDHTADVGIVAYGAELKEAFANAAYAMFTMIADLEGVREEICRQIEVQAEDRESLLASWLNELLYLFDAERIIFKRFEIIELGESSLKAEGYGEPMDVTRHSLKAGVKAATYHLLRVAKDDGYSVRVIFDV
ncbi:MAG TPA: archease [Dehalococcoidia bacterium]|nr:archease [Dehalococcoidia bacterium]